MRAIYQSFCALTFMLVCQLAHSTIMYHAEASSTFSLIDSGGMAISAEFDPSPSLTLAAGNGIALIDTDSQSDPTLFPSSALLQDAEVSGSAGASFGSSMAAALNSFLVILDNSSGTGAATAIFEFTYSWDISLTQSPVSQATMESGFASAFFHLSGFSPSGGETLAIDELDGLGPVAVPAGESGWLVEPTIAFDFFDIVTPAPLIGSATVRAHVLVPELSTDSFSVISDAFGAANHVTEPSLLYILLVGFFSVHLLRKREQ